MLLKGNTTNWIKSLNFYRHIQEISKFVYEILVFVNHSVKHGLREINHEREARVLSAESARGRWRWKMSARGFSPGGRSHTNQKLSLGKRLARHLCQVYYAKRMLYKTHSFMTNPSRAHMITSSFADVLQDISCKKPC